MFSFKPDQTGIVATEWVLDNENRETGIVKLILNGPPANIISIALLDNLTKILNDLRDNARCLGVICVSSLHKRAHTTKKPIFSPGFDLMVFAKNDPALSRDFLYKVTRFNLAVHLLGKPIIGVMFGQCIAGGAVLPCMFDYRIMDSNENRTKMHFNESQIGVAISQFIFDCVTTAVAPNTAAYVMQSAIPLKPQKCLQLGLVNELYDFESNYDGNNNDNSTITNQMIQDKMVEYAITVMQSKYFVSGKFEDREKNQGKINAAKNARKFGRREQINFLENDKLLNQDLDLCMKGFHNQYIQNTIKAFLNPKMAQKLKQKSKL